MSTMKKLGTMKKKTAHAFGKDVYLLGEGMDGRWYWLKDASFDCGWYWGYGYVETYTNNRQPDRAKDINSHSHFDSMFLKSFGIDGLGEFFKETTFDEREAWKLAELMKSYYIARKYSDMLNRGGAHYTTNPINETIKNADEYERINNMIIPAIAEEVRALLTGKAVAYGKG